MCKDDIIVFGVLNQVMYINYILNVFLSKISDSTLMIIINNMRVVS